MPPRWMLWCAAGVSLAAGVWLSLDSTRLSDFERVVAWTGDWSRGISSYTEQGAADYPPWALVTLMPLVWLPHDMRAPIWVAVNLGLALMIVRTVTRDVPPGLGRWLVPALLCLVSLRILSQFSLLSLALALLGVTTHRPALGGLWLGLSLMKPQVGGVIWLAHLGLRDWRRVVLAAAVPVALTLVCAWVLGQTPIALLQDYAAVIGAEYGGETPFSGHTDLEMWIWEVFRSGTSLPVALAICAVLLLPGVVAVSRRQPGTPAAVLELYGFCGVVSLLATRHLSYDLVLLIPLVVAWIAWPMRRWQSAGFALLVWLVVHPPTLWRRLLAPGVPDALSFVTELDRVVCLCLWVIVSARLLRRSSSVLSVDKI